MNFNTMLSSERARHSADKGLWPNRILTDYLDEVVRTAPTRIAVVDDNSVTHKRTELSYLDLDNISRRIACGFASKGIAAGDVVAVQLPNWWQFAAIYLACVRIGAVINPLMPIFRERELEYMLGFAEAKTLIVPSEFRGFDHAKMVDGLRSRLPKLENVFVVNGVSREESFEGCLLDSPWEQDVDSERLFRERRPDPNSVTELMYTSGTTGVPKGVMHTSNTLLCKGLYAQKRLGINDRDSIFMGSPLAHQTGFMYGIFMSVFQGIKCVLQDVWDPDRAVRTIDRDDCTLTLAATPFLADLLDATERSRGNYSGLRLFWCGGAPIPSALVERALEVIPEMQVMSGWGMTEMGIVTSTSSDDPLEKIVNSDGCGEGEQQVRIVEENGKLASVGEEGRLQSRCATLFVGYLNRPEAYEVDAEGWFETGDNARMDQDGYIRITGRSKDIIIRGGENIPVVEVEELLYRHPCIQDAAVVAMPDSRLGEKGCAFLSLKEGKNLDFASMLDYLKSFKIATQYLPEHLEVVTDFPRTPSGKIQKFRLREIAQTISERKTESKSDE
ncbi:MAG: AMP-binding protein, partial [Pseudomonadota bacterium]|nr:AMP-binding protein [Pseudomonadota bacterium]